MPEDYQPIRNRGIFNNRWIMRLMSPLRFAYEANAASDVYRIRDKGNPSRMDWSVKTTASPAQFTKDYRIIARFQDPMTERIVV